MIITIWVKHSPKQEALLKAIIGQSIYYMHQVDKFYLISVLLVGLRI